MPEILFDKRWGKKREKAGDSPYPCKTFHPPRIMTKQDTLIKNVKKVIKNEGQKKEDIQNAKIRNPVWNKK